MVLYHCKVSLSYIEWKWRSTEMKFSARKCGEIFQAFHVEKSKILAMYLFVLEMPGKYFCSITYQFSAIFRESDKLSRNFCYTWNFLTRPECKVCTRKHTLGYINLVQYLHPKGTLLCRNFCHRLKKVLCKKMKILHLFGAYTETTSTKL